MAATDIWMPLYVNDFRGDTETLDGEGVGCYMLLLMWSWTNGPLPLDERKNLRISRLYRDNQKAVLREVLSDFWIKTPDGYINKRLQDEKVKSLERTDAARKKAEKRWKGPMLQHSRSNATAKPQVCSSSSSSSSKSKTNTKKEEKKGAATVPSLVVKESTLYKSIEQAFLSKVGKFTNYGKEGKAIHGLIQKAEEWSPEDPASFIKDVIGTYFKMRQNDKFYGQQPFLPSALNASGIFDRVMVKFEDKSQQIPENLRYLYKEII